MSDIRIRASICVPLISAHLSNVKVEPLAKSPFPVSFVLYMFHDKHVLMGSHLPFGKLTLLKKNPFA